MKSTVCYCCCFLSVLIPSGNRREIVKYCLEVDFRAFFRPTRLHQRTIDSTFDLFIDSTHATNDRLDRFRGLDKPRVSRI